jgi:hypothetical protein
LEKNTKFGELLRYSLNLFVHLLNVKSKYFLISIVFSRFNKE